MHSYSIAVDKRSRSRWGQMLHTARTHFASQGRGIIAALQREVLPSESAVCYRPVVDAHTYAVDKLDVQLCSQRTDTVAAGCWMVQTCVRQAAQWRSEGHAVPILCVPVSADQLTSLKFRSTLIEEAKRHGIALQRVELELADGAAAHANGPQVLEALNAFRHAGVRLAFGEIAQGLSSLSLLRRLDFSSLRIGRQTFGDIDCGEGRQAMVEAAVFLAHSHGMRVVACDVDTEARREFLVEAGCDYLQGHLFGTPAPA